MKKIALIFCVSSTVFLLSLGAFADPPFSDEVPSSDSTQDFTEYINLTQPVQWTEDGEPMFVIQSTTKFRIGSNDLAIYEYIEDPEEECLLIKESDFKEIINIIPYKTVFCSGRGPGCTISGSRRNSWGIEVYVRTRSVHYDNVLKSESLTPGNYNIIEQANNEFRIEPLQIVQHDYTNKVCFHFLLGKVECDSPWAYKACPADANLTLQDWTDKCKVIEKRQIMTAEPQIDKCKVVRNLKR